MREPGSDDDLVPLGYALAALRLGLDARRGVKVQAGMPDSTRAVLLRLLASWEELLEHARARHRDAPWATTEQDIEWGKALRSNIDALRRILEDE